MVNAVQKFLQRVLRSPASGSLNNKVRRLKDIYYSLDRHAAVFKARAGIGCPDQCSECCLHSNVEASELEMLPLALELLRSGDADEWYRRAEARAFEGRCVFYDPDNIRGHCFFYAFRPLVCRLFGFSGNRDKNGRPRMVMCGVLHKTRPHEAEQVLEGVVKGELELPMMADFVMRVSSVDPDMARESVPVNTAFKRAVERAGLEQKFNRRT